MTRSERSERAALRVVVATWLCLAVGTLTPACRYEVRLDDPLDAAIAPERDAPDEAALDAPLDAGVRDDAGAPDAPPDAPGRPCLTGLEVAASPATVPASAPTLATSGALAARRFGLLLPPPARAASATTGLYVLDGEGATLAVEELDLDDGAGAAAATATVHGRRDAPGFLVLAPAEARLRGETGTWTSIALPLPPLTSRQREAGWIDDAHFAYVAEGLGEPVVVVDAASTSATVSGLTTAGAARVLVGLGAVVLVAAAPDPAITEHDAALATTPTLEIDWPGGPIGDRLIGATRSGGRRWLVHDAGEFRTQTELYRVEAAGPSFVLRQQLLGPLVTASEDDLVTITTADGGLTVFDFASDTFVPLLAGGASGLGLAERADDGYVVVTREPGATGDALVFRCIAP